MNVLIAGCGRLGGAIARRALAGGHVVYGLRRRTELLPADVRAIRADLTRLDAGVLPDDLDVCICTVSADGRDARSYRAAYVDGVARLVDALQGWRGRLVYTSSTGVYGESGGAAVDEATAPEPASERSRLLLEAERIVTGRAPGSVVARLSGLYGTGRTRLLDAVRSGTARGAAGRGPWTNRVHDDDAARAVLHLATLDEPARVCLVTDDEPARRGDVLAWLAQRTGRALLPPNDGEGGAEPGGKRCVNAALAATGFAFRYPTYREGYEAILAARGGT